MPPAQLQRLMFRNTKLVLAYDGTRFHGWQRQPGMRTVQGTVEDVARRVLGHPLHVTGTSRTDAGVHARGQVASLPTPARIPLDNIRRAVGERLPADVALLHVAEVPPAFHASRDAAGKMYRYRIHNAVRRPAAVLTAPFVWHVWFPLDVDRLRDAGRRLVGTHDFAGFASRGAPRVTTVRTIRRVDIRRVYSELHIEVEGDGFLYNQVRNIVGTLFEIGRGHWPTDRVDEILATRNRSLAGPTAPAQGLCLQWVRLRPGACDHGT